MKIKNTETKNSLLDRSDHKSNIDVAYVKKNCLTKSYIKRRSFSLGSTVLGLLLTVGLGIVGYQGLVSEESTIWVVIPFLGSLMFLLGTFFSLKDSLYKIKKINLNEFVLARAVLKESYEDVSTAEGPYLIGDSYLTYVCRGEKIKIKKSGSSEEQYINNSTAYFAFLSKKGYIDEVPFLLFIGKDYEIDNTIKTI